MPTAREHYHDLLEQVTRFQYRMRAKEVQVAITKPLFDTITGGRNVTPDLVVAFPDHRTGEEGDFAVQVLRSRDPDYLEIKHVERTRTAHIRTTLTGEPRRDRV